MGSMIDSLAGLPGAYQLILFLFYTQYLLQEFHDAVIVGIRLQGVIRGYWVVHTQSYMKPIQTPLDRFKTLGCQAGDKAAFFLEASRVNDLSDLLQTHRSKQLIVWILTHSHICCPVRA